MVGDDTVICQLAHICDIVGSAFQFMHELVAGHRSCTPTGISHLRPGARSRSSTEPASARQSPSRRPCCSPRVRKGGAGHQAEWRTRVVETASRADLQVLLRRAALLLRNVSGLSLDPRTEEALNSLPPRWVRRSRTWWKRSSTSGWWQMPTCRCRTRSMRRAR